MTSFKRASEKKKVDPLEVSYIIHKFSRKEKRQENISDTLEKISACINVQLGFGNSSKKNSRLFAPFISPKVYDDIKNESDKAVFSVQVDAANLALLLRSLKRTSEILIE